MLKISDFLSNGERDAISLEQLSIATGLPERAVKKEVLNARLRGELVLSSERGYFLPESEAEIKSYVFKRKSYLRTAHAALKPFIQAVKS